VSWCDDLCEELVLEAMKIAVEQGTKKWGYVEAILKNWFQKGIRTLEQSRAEQQQFKEQRTKRTPVRSSGKVRPIRTERLPDWFDENKTSTQNQRSDSSDYDFEKEKAKLEAELLAFKRG
jgi:DNA replication protein DnaD